MHTVTLLKHIIESYQSLVYIFIFVGLIFEGEFILIATGIFLHLGALDFSLTFITVVLGLLSKTLLGYYIGNYIKNRWHHVKFLRYVEKRAFKIMPHFKRRPFWSIFVSKFIFGANNIVILFAGYHKIDFKKYLKAETLSTMVWAPVLVFLGYFFSYTALHFSREIWRFSFFVLLFVVLFILLDKLISTIYEAVEDMYHDH